MSNIPPTTKVLVVADDDAERSELLDRLAALGLQYQAVAGVEAALKQLQVDPHAYNLAIVDFELPGMNGLVFLVEVTSSKELRHVPVVMTSTSHDHLVIETFTTVGAAACLSQPYTQEELQTAIIEALRLK